MFKTKPFARFANREGITDEALCNAATLAAGAIVEVRCDDQAVQK